jgi:hypothetical protein
MAAKLEQDLSSVRLDCPDGDSQYCCHLLIRFPLGQEANDFKLARGSYEDFAGFEPGVRRSVEPGDKARDSRAKSRRTCQAVANEPYVLLARAAAERVGSSSRAAHISAR